MSEDKRVSISRADRPAGRGPAVWSVRQAVHLGGAASDRLLEGRYPQGFLEWCRPMMRAAPSTWLHVCSGGLGPDTEGTRIDVRPEMQPDVVADGTDLPFADDSFGGVLIDPPYSAQHSEDMYGVKYPRPSALLREAARVVKPCGRIGFTHFLVPNPPGGTRIVGCWGIITGCGYRIRAWTLYEKEQDGMDFEAGKRRTEEQP